MKASTALCDLKVRAVETIGAYPLRIGDFPTSGACGKSENAGVLDDVAVFRNGLPKKFVDGCSSAPARRVPAITRGCPVEHFLCPIQVHCSRAVKGFRPLSS